MNRIRKVVIMKPEIKPNESEDDYVARCIPWVIENEGATASQAAGKCHGMFRNKMSKKYSLNINELGDSIEKVYVEKPYPNEHACRIREPGEFQDDSFRRISQGGLSIIIGRLKGKTSTTTQAFRYPKDSYTADRAREHCTKNEGSFSAASGEKTEKFDISVSKMELFSYTADEDFEIDTIQIKKGQELHYILGVVLEPESVDATRTEETIGDIYSEDEIRKAAHYFLANYGGRGNDFMHDGKASDKLKIVESFLAPIDMKIGDTDIKKGTWLMGTLVLDNEIWNKVKKGEITGYSIGGRSGAKVEVA